MQRSITAIRTKLYEWNGPTVPPQKHFCTNASDLLRDSGDPMGSFRFHRWLVCEVESDDGAIGYGNAALSPAVAKTAIDQELAQYVVGEDPFDYARRMIPMLVEFEPRWLEEPVIADDISGYAELNKGPIPISGGEHEFSLLGVNQLLDAKAVSVLQYDTNRVGGITAAQKINAVAEARQIPVIPHAGQMHNYHLTMANVNCPISEYFPIGDVEVGNELFYYIFDGDPEAKDGYLDLDDETPGLGLTLSDRHLSSFTITE